MRFKNLKDHHLIQTTLKNTQQSEFNLKAIGLVGTIGFPAYYIIWEYLFPQPYENLTLRMLGCLLSIPFVLIEYWPENLKKHFLPFYWIGTFIYALPFFFTFMTLMNDASSVWGMSTIASILLLFLVVNDWLLINIMFIVGSTLAWLSYILIKGEVTIPYAYIEQLPIYIFILISGSIFSHKSELLRQERLRIMLTIGGNIAHELRTPLLGIKSGINGLRSYLPKLLETYQIAQKSDIEIPQIRSIHLKALETLLERIDSETEFSNSIIDMLLMNSGNLNIDKNKFSQYSINKCISTAVNRYPFQSHNEREIIKYIPSDDFYFFGSDILYIHLIFNLIKNSLQSIYEAGKGEITIKTEKRKNENLVIFRDTGKGIDATILPRIFNQFYTTAPHGKGAGIGLSFCKQVMESFDGEIQASSTPGQYAEFIMKFKEC